MASPEIDPPPKDRITCHVLDQTTGHPASSLDVTLILLRPKINLQSCFRSTTSNEGRITSWTPCEDEQQKPPPVSLADIFLLLDQDYKAEPATIWSLTFNTEKYFGKGKSFFPEAEVKFFIDLNERKEEGTGHVHVPLLLAPWGYTTYRGS